tara:strand:- start:632 stop:1270 length:639 start_codon:yes stop_codon:yes gene_type:complete
MKDIVVCGTGSFARELYGWIKLSEANQHIKFKGFLDKDNKSLINFGLEKYYLGNEESYNEADDDFYLIAIADVKDREIIYKKLKNKNCNFYNYIHDSVIIGGDITLGEANIICPNSVFTTDIKIGDCNIFNINTTIGHDVVIDSFNTFSSHCDVTGNVSIVNNNFFGSRVSLLPKCKIGSSNKIAAGSVIYKGIKDNSVYIGNPARKVSNNV